MNRNMNLIYVSNFRDIAIHPYSEVILCCAQLKSGYNTFATLINMISQFSSRHLQIQTSWPVISQSDIIMG